MEAGEGEEKKAERGHGIDERGFSLVLPDVAGSLAPRVSAADRQNGRAGACRARLGLTAQAACQHSHDPLIV